MGAAAMSRKRRTTPAQEATFAAGYRQDHARARAVHKIERAQIEGAWSMIGEFLYYAQIEGA